MGEQKPSPSTLQNMSNVPEYSENVVPSVRQRKAMLSDKIGQVTEAGLQSPKRSAQSESTVRETGVTTPAAKPAIAPKPAVAPKPVADAGSNFKQNSWCWGAKIFSCAAEHEQYA
ncbi:hypothetical protein U370_01750 [Anaplasma marginale str. Dawn]|nr:hypothetical protein U370_01750 [Anaplasma marginale str. Dawn]